MKIIHSKPIAVPMAALAVLLAVFLAGCQNQAAPGGNAAQNDDIALKAAAPAGNADSGNDGISVSGQGSVSVKPDVATISLGVETMDADAAKARKANDTAMAKVLTAVKAFGVADDDIKTSNYSIYPRYDEKGQKITGYTVANTVSVKVKNLDKLGEMLEAAGAAGANTAGGIGFDVQDRTAAYNEALAQAMEKARARAEIMAKACGVKLGRVLTINESSSYSGPVYESDEKRNLALAAGEVPVSSGQMEVTATVSVVYEIVK
jgi:uncharacterized protein YggE